MAELGRVDILVSAGGRALLKHGWWRLAIVSAGVQCGLALPLLPPPPRTGPLPSLHPTLPVTFSPPSGQQRERAARVVCGHRGRAARAGRARDAHQREGGGRQRRLHYTCRLTASTRQSLHRFAHELKHRTRLTAVRDHTPTPCASQVFGYVFMVKAVAPHMKEGASIINTVSVRRYK